MEIVWITVLTFALLIVAYLRRKQKRQSQRGATYCKQSNDLKKSRASARRKYRASLRKDPQRGHLANRFA